MALAIAIVGLKRRPSWFDCGSGRSCENCRSHLHLRRAHDLLADQKGIRPSIRKERRNSPALLLLVGQLRRARTWRHSHRPPHHFSADGKTLDQVPLSNCIGPAAVIDFSARAATTPTRCSAVDDIKSYEAAYGQIPDGAIVVARSGWGNTIPTKSTTWAPISPAMSPGFRFPGYSAAAVDFLLKNRNVIAIAIDTASMDPGNSKDFPVHRAWLGANKPGFENLAHAEKCRPKARPYFAFR